MGISETVQLESISFSIGSIAYPHIDDAAKKRHGHTRMQNRIDTFATSDAARGVRKLVELHGRDRSLQMVEPEDTSLVRIASEVLGDESGRRGYSYSGLCLTSLPHRKLADEQPWIRTVGPLTLIIEPGRILDSQERIMPDSTASASKGMQESGFCSAYGTQASPTQGGAICTPLQPTNATAAN